MANLSEYVNSREIVIAGIGKYQQDFEYVFSELEVVMYIADDYNGTEYQEKRVVPLKKVKSTLLADKLVIICESRKASPIEDALKLMRLEGQGKDYIFAEELFTTLDFDIYEMAGGRKFAFWDYSHSADRNIERTLVLKHMRVKVYVSADYENYKSNEYMSFNDALKNKDDYYFIIVSDNYQFAYESLTEAGLFAERDFISYKSLLFEQGEQKPSAMMTKTVFSKSYNQSDCYRPFIHAFLGAHGRMDCCCISRINKGYGDYTCMDYDKSMEF